MDKVRKKILILISANCESAANIKSVILVELNLGDCGNKTTIEQVICVKLFYFSLRRPVYCCNEQF